MSGRKRASDRAQSERLIDLTLASLDLNDQYRKAMIKMIDETEAHAKLHGQSSPYSKATLHFIQGLGRKHAELLSRSDVIGH